MGLKQASLAWDTNQRWLTLPQNIDVSIYDSFPFNYNSFFLLYSALNARETRVVSGGGGVYRGALRSKRGPTEA